ncbi:MAG: AraC family transcriptional regulator [Cyanobacteria bacterium P01_D01_bin.105]
MTIKLTENEFEEQFQETNEEALQCDPSDTSDIIYKFDARISQGWRRDVDLREGLRLRMDHHHLCDHIVINSYEEECAIIWLWFTLSGQGEDIFFASKSSEFLNLSVAGKYYLQSNGLGPPSVSNYSDAHPHSYIGVEINPSTLHSFVSSPEEALPKNLQHLIKRPSQEAYFRSGDTQPMMATVLQQILHCPYQGMVKRAYLEGKLLELIALVLDHEVTLQQGEVKKGALKPEQIERIHYAREILLRDMYNPPSLVELARQVGLNDFLLKKGFRQVFGNTVFGELQAYRLELAKQLLAEGSLSAAEISRLAGYAHPNSFARAFKQKFGISPTTYRKSCRLT